jgi:hypothetical protein
MTARLLASVAAMALLGALVVAPSAFALSKVKSCGTTTLPAPQTFQCTFPVGAVWKTITGIGFGHAACVAAAKPTVSGPCYAGRMTVDLSWNQGLKTWHKQCDEVLPPAGGPVKESCTKTGTLPAPGTAFTVSCRSLWYGTPGTIVGGVGWWTCWVGLTV